MLSPGHPGSVGDVRSPPFCDLPKVRFLAMPVESSAGLRGSSGERQVRIATS
ncbi:MAG: hypothetical protein Q7U11_04070 [Phenylobacterium sp.]|nr:hypothetical protein [Phenylobacterium sp.]